MFKKRIVSLIAALGLLFTMIPFAGACHENIIATEIIDLGDGIALEVKTVEIVSALEPFSDYKTKEYYKSANAKSGSKIIGTYIYMANFNITVPEYRP